MKKALLDVDASAGTSKACAEAVDHSLKKVDLPEERKILSGQNTDAGGGGTGKSFRIELTKVQQVDELHYMDPTCGIHAHNLTLKNPVSQLFGEGGLNKRNALQLIHSAYNLQYGGGMEWNYKNLSNFIRNCL